MLGGRCAYRTEFLFKLSQTYACTFTILLQLQTWPNGYIKLLALHRNRLLNRNETVALTVIRRRILLTEEISISSYEPTCPGGNINSGVQPSNYFKYLFSFRNSDHKYLHEKNLH